MLEKVQSLGAHLIAVSPQIPTETQISIEKNDVTFRVLSDPGNAVAQKYGLVFALPGDLREVYLKLGIDLAKVNGDGSWELPIPATYVIATDGRVQAVHARGDYVRRMEPEHILDALRALGS